MWEEAVRVGKGEMHRTRTRGSLRLCIPTNVPERIPARAIGLPGVMCAEIKTAPTLDVSLGARHAPSFSPGSMCTMHSRQSSDNVTVSREENAMANRFQQKKPPATEFVWSTEAGIVATICICNL